MSPYVKISPQKYASIPEDLVGGEELGSSGRDLVRAKPPSQKKSSLEMACFGEFGVIFLKTWGQFALASGTPNYGG